MNTVTHYKWCFTFLNIKEDGSLNLFCEEAVQEGVKILPEYKMDPDRDFNIVIEHFKETIGVDLPIFKYIPLRQRITKNHEIIVPYLVCTKDHKDILQKEKWIEINQIDEMSSVHGSILCEVLSLFWRDFSHFRIDETLALKRYGIPEENLEKTIFYGGSFNPFHQGHEACIKLCHHQGNIVVVPDQNPFKHLKTDLCAWKYYQDLRRNLEKFKCYVYPGFCGLEVSNPSYRWLKEYKSQFSLLMGDDSFISLPLWSYPDQFLTKTAKIYIVPRDENRDQIEDVSKWVRGINPQIQIDFLSNHSFQKISSTQLRNKR